MTYLSKKHSKSEKKQNNIVKLISIKRRKGFIDIDPRIKILISLAFNALLFLTTSKTTIFFSFATVFIILFFSEKTAIAINFFGIFLFFCIADFFIFFSGIEKIRIIFGVFIYSIMKFIPIIMIGSWISATTRINDFITAMEKIKIPGAVIIPLAVLLRFLPTIREELGYIQDTMKMRNIEFSIRTLAFKPTSTMEHILIPLLMRSIKLADELSAAALTRGLDSENKRTSIREIKIVFSDIAFVFVLFGFIALLLFLDKKVFVLLSLKEFFV